MTNELEVKIYGGEPAKQGEFPYMARITEEGPNRTLSWGATIISERHVITTATTVKGLIAPFKNLIVWTGRIERNKGETHTVRQISLHPSYFESNPNVTRYNIGIIMLCQRINFNENQKPVKLPTRKVLDSIKAVVTGWGRRDINKPTSILQKLTVTAYSVETCNKTYGIGPFNDKSRICTINKKGTSYCGGDGGSPLVANGELIGVVLMSKDHKCDSGKGWYVNIYECLDYIEKKIDSQVCRAYTPGTTVMARIKDE